MQPSMPLEAQRRQVITPAVVETLLDRYQVPSEKRGLMRIIVDFYLKHADDPKQFGKEARAYTVQEHIDPADANAALVVFMQVRNDIIALLQKSAAEN